MEHFDVYVAGFDVSEARATQGLMQVFGIGQAQAHGFVQSVPRIAKHRLARANAEPYAAALRTIGAAVELRPSGPSHEPNSGRPSLPGPSGMSATNASAASSIPPALMPVIPRAPRLPQGLTPMHATADHPADLAVTPRGAALAQAQAAAASDDPPLQLDTMPTASTSPSIREHGAVRHDHVGMSHAFTPSRPGSSLTARDDRMPPRSVLPWHASGANRLLVLGLLVGVGYQAYVLGWFRSATEERRDAFARAGITTGRFEEARAYLSRPSNRFAGLTRAQLDTLVAGVERAGASHLWVVDIATDADVSSARSLVIELPDDATARRTIFWRHAREATHGAVPEDTGQRYLRLDF